METELKNTSRALESALDVCIIVRDTMMDVLAASEIKNKEDQEMCNKCNIFIKWHTKTFKR